MSVTYLGPIPIGVLYDPDFTWDDTPARNGLRQSTITGRLTWNEVQQLEELVGNPHRKVTIAGRAGVLEYIATDDSLLAAAEGWYLLESMDVEGSQRASVTGLVGFSLKCLYLGPRQPVVPHSARGLPNDFAIQPVAVLTDPFGQSFLTPPDGTKMSREYDPRSEIDVASPTVDPALVDVYLEAL